MNSLPVFILSLNLFLTINILLGLLDSVKYPTSQSSAQPAITGPWLGASDVGRTPTARRVPSFVLIVLMDRLQNPALLL